MLRPYYLTKEYSLSCRQCKVKAYFGRKWSKKVLWQWYDCPYNNECEYGKEMLKAFNNSGFKTPQHYLNYTNPEIPTDPPRSSAQILTLKDVIKHYLKEDLYKGVYYLIDNNIEFEQLELEYKYLVDKFKENPKYTVSYYPE